MIIGHYGPGFAGKALVGRVSLGTMFLAVTFTDLLYAVLMVLGVEQARSDAGGTPFMPFFVPHFPISHSLLGAAASAVVFALIYFALRRDLAAAAALALGVASHWVLDWINQPPNLEIVPGGTKVGLGLWNSVGWTVAAELVVFLGGLALYIRATRAKDRAGYVALWVLAAVLVLPYLAAVALPPGPHQQILTALCVSPFLVVPLGYWIDRHRRPAREG
jgi:LexA-binding, inner membrane-associated putative hydrolase